jgi:hypothetical protein
MHAETDPALPPSHSPEAAPGPRTSKARRTHLAAMERIRNIQSRMWELPEEGGLEIADAGPRASPRQNCQASLRSSPPPTSQASLRSATMEIDEEEQSGTGPLSSPPKRRQRHPRDPPPASVPVAAVADRAPELRRKFSHPLDNDADAEIELWVYDETVGSLSQMARMNLGVEPDTWARAAWRACVAMEHTVLGIPIKNRRRLYTLMRSASEDGGAAERSEAVQEERRLALRAPPSEAKASGGAAPGPAAATPSTADHLVPELGMTLGHLSVFHILHARTQYTKQMDLAARVERCDLMRPEMMSRLIRIDGR